MPRYCLHIIVAMTLFLFVSAGAVQADTATYTYDALGRLTQVVHSNGAITTYNYDAAGNRTSRTSTAGNGGNSTVVVLPLLGGLVLPVG